MATTTLPPYDFAGNKNNPTKEILASSGIWDGQTYAPTLFAPDISDSTVPNTGINTTTTTTSTTTYNPLVSGTQPDLGPISSGNFIIDDMLIFNKYIHYSKGSFGSVRTFNPQTFLTQSVVTFNIYNLNHTVPSTGTIGG